MLRTLVKVYYMNVALSPWLIKNAVGKEVDTGKCVGKYIDLSELDLQLWLNSTYYKIPYRRYWYVIRAFRVIRYIYEGILQHLIYYTIFLHKDLFIHNS